MYYGQLENREFLISSARRFQPALETKTFQYSTFRGKNLVIFQINITDFVS